MGLPRLWVWGGIPRVLWFPGVPSHKKNIKKRCVRLLGSHIDMGWKHGNPFILMLNIARPKENK